MVKHDSVAELALGEEFDRVVQAMFPAGMIPVQIVAGACVRLLNTYSHPVPSVDRVLLINEIAEAMIADHHQHIDADLLLAH